MTHREVLESLSGILLGMFVSILATSVVSSSLPRIITDLGGTQSAFTWVVTATLLTTTISTPIWGKLADLVDRKLLIQLALAISVVSSALAGLSHGTGMLIGMRALQGIGAGGLTALGTVLIADIISPRERGRYMGLMGAVMGIGMVGGPLLGGVITDGAGLALELLRRPAVRGRRDHRAAAHAAPARAQAPRKVKIDYLGATLLSVGIATLLLWITFAGTSFDWASWQTAAMVGGSIVALGARRLGRVPRRASRSSRCTCSRTARWSSPSSRASPSASPCSAPRCSSASTCSWPAARRRRSPACSPSR